MRIRCWFILVGIFLFLQAPVAGAAEERRADTLRLKVYFERGASAINTGYKDNAALLEAFVRACTGYLEDPSYSLSVFSVRTGASPEGNTKSNQDLSEARAQTLTKHLSEILHLSDDTCELFPMGEYWAALEESLLHLPQPPSWVPEALDIVRNTPVWVLNEAGEIVDSRKNQLKRLSDGEAWYYLKANVFPECCPVGEVQAIFLRVSFPPSQPSAVVTMPDPKTTAWEDAGHSPGTASQGPLPGNSDTLEILFRLDSTRIDLDYAGNRERVSGFVNAYHRRFAHYPYQAVQLDIYAGASPEGAAYHNEWLGRERGESIRRLLCDSLGIRIGTTVPHNLAARWSELYESIAASEEPWKEEVLTILREEPTRNRFVKDRRETLLRQLQGGAVWPELAAKYLAPLRSGGSAILSYHPERDTVFYADKGPSQKDTIVVKDTLFIVQNAPYDGLLSASGALLPEGYYFGEDGRIHYKKVKKVLVPADKTPAWAVKTNLLFWGALAPNVQIEVPIGRNNRWSLEWEYVHPWFIWGNNSHASQILDMGLELRIYLGKRKFHRWLDGWHVGLAAAIGKYDWEWKQHEGWQGEFVNVFANIGYQHRFGKHWALDFGLGLGVLPSRYRHYYGGSVYPESHLEAWDQHLIWHDTGSFLYPGATHVHLSIAYMFNNWPFRFKTRKP